MNKKAHFITGFSNWGKTTLITGLFNQQVFRNIPHEIPGLGLSTRFVVQSQSNDDIRVRKYVETIIDKCTKTKSKKLDLFATICPALEAGYDIREIFQHRFFNQYEEFHFYPIKYKWDYQAELREKEVNKTITDLPINIHVHWITEPLHSNLATRLAMHVEQVREEIRAIYRLV